MESSNATPAKGIARTWLDRAVLLLALTWFAVHVALYATRIYQADPATLLATCWSLAPFFACQAAAFLVFVLVTARTRPAVIGRRFGIFVSLSTVALLACSRDVSLVIGFALLSLWAVCATNGVRLAIARVVGECFGTWGVAAAATYALLIPICFLLGLIHAITPWVVAIVAITSALPGAVDLAQRLPDLRQKLGQSFRRLGPIEVCLLEAIWIVFAIGFVGASTSEVRSDSTRVHLPYIHQVVADHGISHQYACWHRLQPMAAQTCYAAVASLGSDRAAKWFSWLVIVALTLLVAEETTLRSGSARLGMFAGAAVLGCPLLVVLSATLYVDHMLALLCTGGFVVLFRALRPPCLRGILLSACIMGSLAGVKYTGLVFCVLWGLWLFASLLRQCNWRLALRWSFVGGILLVTTALPWNAYVYAGTGNPFYPYLQNWFHSPFWPDNFTLQQVFEQVFKLDPGIAGVAAYPWAATYHTKHYCESVDGSLGFWGMALAACLFLAWRRRTSPYFDMAIVGTAMIACILVYTPYIRYWLPAYPLLVTSCVLAAGSLVSSSGWWSKLRSRPVSLGLAAAGLLVLPIPFTCIEFPWAEYAHRISTEERLSQHFDEYGAFKQFNQIVAPSGGVLCTGCSGVYLSGGRPYEFAFWWNDIHRIHDLPSFDDFCQRNGIHYWAVNHFSPMSLVSPDLDSIPAKYWTDERAVAASGTVVVYDVTARNPQPRQALTERHWPAMMEKMPDLWSPATAATHWVDTNPNVTTDQTDGAILVDSQERIGHILRPERQGGLCKVQCNLWSEDISYPVLEIVWYDAQGKVIGRASGNSAGESDHTAQIYSPVPPEAEVGWVFFRKWQGIPVHLQDTVVTYWGSQGMDARCGK